MENDLKLTSVKVLKELHTKFKQETLIQEFTLQKLVNRSIFLYINDEEFKNSLDNFDELKQYNKHL